MGRVGQWCKLKDETPLRHRPAGDVSSKISALDTWLLTKRWQTVTTHGVNSIPGLELIIL